LFLKKGAAEIVTKGFEPLVEIVNPVSAGTLDSLGL
jgi:hypothetical protein